MPPDRLTVLEVSRCLVNPGSTVARSKEDEDLERGASGTNGKARPSQDRVMQNAGVWRGVVPVRDPAWWFKRTRTGLEQVLAGSSVQQQWKD